jgi:nucleoside-diphosphate-sugar epimerase
VEDLKSVEPVVYMGEPANDPVEQLALNIIYEIDHKGSVHLAKLARKAGVKRFVYMLSCNEYGVLGGDFVDEKSPIKCRMAYVV